MANDLNWVAILVAVLGAGGVGAAVREIVSAVSLARKGVSGKEDKRRIDIITQRDHALKLRDEAEAGERAADARADREATWRRSLQEEVARLRRNIIMLGQDPGLDTTRNPWEEPK